MKLSLIRSSLLAFLILAIVSGCNIPRREASSTDINVTQAYETVQARLTQNSQSNTSSQGTPTPTTGLTSPTPLTTPPTITPTREPTANQPTTTSRFSCDQASPGNPIDVTIPDDTPLQPGQSFTKVWRLQNTGTCTWNNTYAVAFFSGDQMGAPASVALAGDVAPGQSVDISVDMVAPSKAGNYQGNWKLRNASNVLFGIGPGGAAPFWVRIVVSVTSTPSSTPRTPTPTSTPTATATATSPVHIVGTANLNVGATLDLDNDQINGGGADIIYEPIDSKHQLAPQDSTLLGVYGMSQPGQANCQSSSLDTSPIVVEDIPLNSYICYRTHEGRYGRARLSEFNAVNFTVRLEFLTWP